MFLEKGESTLWDKFALPLIISILGGIIAGVLVRIRYGELLREIRTKSPIRSIRGSDIVMGIVVILVFIAFIIMACLGWLNDDSPRGPVFYDPATKGYYQYTPSGEKRYTVESPDPTSYK